MSKTVEEHVLKIYCLVKELGSGAYGYVWEVKQKKSNKRFALKKIFDAFRNSIDAQRTYREVEILYRLNHPNIIKLHRVIKSKNKKDLYLVFEFMEADLHSVLGTNILSKMHQIYIFYQILKAIHYLHSAELIHRDLKPSNVLLNSQSKAKICDFGLIRSLISSGENSQVVLSEEVATKWYRAPELLLGSRSYGKSVDIWSFGCIMAQILTGKPLFNGNSTLNQFQKILQFTGHISLRDLQSLDSPVAEQFLPQIKIKKKQFTEYFGCVDQDFYQLLKGTLEFNPVKRLTAFEAIKLPIFKDYATDTIINAKEVIIPQIDDNVRLSIKAYRQRIYDDIDSRYGMRVQPTKNTIHEVYYFSTPKYEKERSRSKKRLNSVKKTSQSYHNRSSSPRQKRSSHNPSASKKKTSTNGPCSNKILNNKFAQIENLMENRKTKVISQKCTQKQTDKGSIKVMKRGCKTKMNVIDKKGLIGLDKSHLKKFLK